MKKDELRKSFLKQLSLLSSSDVEMINKSLTQQLIKFFSIFPELSSQIGGSFLPLKKEVAPLNKELMNSISQKMAYPILSDGKMQFAWPLQKAQGQTWLELPYQEVQPYWLIIPGVAFDLSGGRLGRGRGFYDRYLTTHKVVKVGVIWSEQLREKVPLETHDVLMDFIITEKFCWDVTQQKRF